MSTSEFIYDAFVKATGLIICIYIGKWLGCLILGVPL